MNQDFDPKQKAGFAATLLAAALPYLGAFSFGTEARAASSIDREPIPTATKQNLDLSDSTLPKIAAELLPDGREINSKLDPNSIQKLEKGAEGNWASFLQVELNKEGFALEVDGNFGEKTNAAVCEFQKAHGLKVDGVVGPKTWQTLLELDSPINTQKLNQKGEAPVVIDLSQNKDMRALLRWHEGVRSDLYLCTAGKCTIGVGHNLEAKGSKKEIEFYKNNRASNEQIEQWLTKDIQDVVSKLDKALGKETWYQNLSPNRKMVLVDMGFNLGTDGLLKFDRTLELMKNSNFEQAAEQMLKSKWAKQVGDRANRLAEIVRTDTLPKIQSQFYK